MATAKKAVAQYTTTKKAKAAADATATKVAKDFGIVPAKKAVAKGSVAKTFDVNKLKPKMTPQDKASLAMLKKKYGKGVYQSYGN